MLQVYTFILSTGFNVKKNTTFLMRSIAAAHLFTLCLNAPFYRTYIKGAPPKRPSLLWLVSSHRPELASFTMFLHQLRQFSVTSAMVRGRGWRWQIANGRLNSSADLSYQNLSVIRIRISIPLLFHKQGNLFATAAKGQNITKKNNNNSKT